MLRDLDRAGDLRLRVNAYLVVNENSAEGRLLGDYFNDHEPGESVSPHVRVAGLKVFTDFANATVLLWNQADLDAFVAARHAEGWQLAIKTVSATSLAMILEAGAAARAADPTFGQARPRLEHMLFATPEQIAAITDLGFVPAINTNVPGQLVGEPDIEALVAREPVGAYAPWRSLFEALLTPAGISGFPSFHVEEPTGAPFGSPIHLIYQAVTRVGNLGTPSPAELLEEALIPEQAMAAHTINAASAAFEDDVKGSITPGKLADLVVLSGDPLAVLPAAINDITVLMTMIGGRVEHCAAGSEAICPDLSPSGTPAPGAGSTPPPNGVSLGAGATVTASSELPGAEADRAVDGTPAHWNAAGLSPQWIEIVLAEARRVDAINLVVAQDPGGPSRHELWVRRTGGEPTLVQVFEGLTADGDVLRFEPAARLEAVELVRVVTTDVGDLFPAWKEIEVIGPPGS